ncbi:MULTISPECIES: hypothetical protein [Campylobacter]|uniref:Integral membrane protein n=1 Tax=Campylobacter porcelli TaxID=1660073 RepID=A0ABU7M2R0_9BACT|nr:MULTISPECIES: hypothetical protein [unclassified Campylobacter]MCR8695651.1 hypothetical protein [Campylobacter sp. RM19073]MEE3743994.1 hypothetical protein [Campylobacter sp. CX2-4855-23]
MKFKNLAIFYLILDALLIAITSAYGAVELLNSQIAFICSNLILFASYLGYKNRVKNRSINYELSDKELEIFEDEENENNQNIKDDKDSIKFRKIDILGAFKPLRLISYLILIVAFFALLRAGIFEPISFLMGLALMPLGVFCAGVFYARK